MTCSIGPVPGADRRREGAAPTRLGSLLTRAIVLAVAAVVLMASVPLAEACEEPATVDLITGGSASDVLGVVEYEVIAESLVGPGASVGATKRIWGGIVADRWMVVPSASRCSETPATGLGDRWYLLVGPIAESGGQVFGIPSSAELSDLEAGALAAIVGEPVSVEISSLDRAMAWMRVNWWLLGFGLVAVVAIVAVVQYRTSNSRRDYLF
jgi:hypothetical protein